MTGIAPRARSPYGFTEKGFGSKAGFEVHTVGTPTPNPRSTMLTGIALWQSMNFIVGILLIMDVGEEDAFWIIAHVSDSLLPNHFAPPMLGAQVPLPEGGVGVGGVGLNHQG